MVFFLGGDACSEKENEDCEIASDTGTTVNADTDDTQADVDEDGVVAESDCEFESAFSISKKYPSNPF